MGRGAGSAHWALFDSEGSPSFRQCARGTGRLGSAAGSAHCSWSPPAEHPQPSVFPPGEWESEQPHGALFRIKVTLCQVPGPGKGQCRSSAVCTHGLCSPSPHAMPGQQAVRLSLSALYSFQGKEGGPHTTWQPGLALGAAHWALTPAFLMGLSGLPQTPRPHPAMHLALRTAERVWRREDPKDHLP